MAKRIIVLGLAAAMLFLSGCASMFQKEYLSVTNYTDEEHGDLNRGVVEVSSYGEFRAALSDMVKNHVEEERLRLTNYTNSQGEDISDLSLISREVLSDFALISREIKDETALGSFSVDYMTSDPIGRIVTYYEVTVRVQYKRTMEEIEAISSLHNVSRLASYLDDSLTNLDTYAAFRLNSVELTDADIISAVSAAFNANPASCVLRPELEVRIHPASAGIERIVEIEFDYGRTGAAITGLRQELRQAVQDITSGITAQEDQPYALAAYNILAGRVRYDPEGKAREEDRLDAELGGSVYGALVESVADSQGIALAYSALCHERGIECIVVTGTFDKIEHYWNIIKLGDKYYHVDVSADSTLGISASFGRGDYQMTGNYWWNIADYPVCEAPLQYDDAFAS